jgi:hypothetical protein
MASRTAWSVGWGVCRHCASPGPGSSITSGVRGELSYPARGSATTPTLALGPSFVGGPQHRVDFICPLDRPVHSTNEPFRVMAMPLVAPEPIGPKVLEEHRRDLGVAYPPWEPSEMATVRTTYRIPHRRGIHSIGKIFRDIGGRLY